MNKTYLPARMDLPHTYTTVTVSLLFFFFLLGAALRGGVLWFVFGLLAVIMFISQQMSPKRYEISDTDMTIIRGWPFKNVAIPLDQVRVVRDVKLPWSTIRTGGVGGLFGSGGWFWNKEIGSFFAAFTNGHKLVFIDARRKYVISPEDPEGFIAEVSKLCSQPRNPV